MLQTTVELRCEAGPAPFVLRPYAGLYNPFSHGCSVLCNHPADTDAKEFVRRAKEAWALEGKTHNFQEDLSKIQDDKEKNRTPHDIVTEDMFRRYTETDSRPLTPAPTLASGKSRGSRRCLTPDQPRQKTTIVLDLRRSHSQETLYYRGYGTSELTAGHSATNDRSTLPSLNLSESGHDRLVTVQCEHLPPIASPLVLSKRDLPAKEPLSVRTARKEIRNTKKYKATKQNARKSQAVRSCDCTSLHLSRVVIESGSKKRRRFPPNAVTAVTSCDPTSTNRRIKLPNVQVKSKAPKNEKSVEREDFFSNLENQLKALNLSKTVKSKKNDMPASQRSKGDKDSNSSNRTENAHGEDIGGGEVRRRGKRRRKVRGGSDRLTSAGLAAQAQQDPETQIAGIGTNSHNASSRGSIAIAEDVPLPLIVKPVAACNADSFLEGDILKYLHREVDEEAIETEFDTKRRYVLQEALRTRGSRPPGPEMMNLLRELQVSSVSLSDWLHIPRVFSRQNGRFGLPIDTYELEALSPMLYAARFVTVKKSKQLLYLTVLRKFTPQGYRMPIKDIDEGLILMMGGILNKEHVNQFKAIMEWDSYTEGDNIPDEIKLTLLDEEYKAQFPSQDVDSEKSDLKTIKYRTWCGLCAICERMYGRFPPREKDPPDGMELSDFTMIETKLSVLKVHSSLIEILNVIRVR
ncbi:unnamed protein product, partial [Iphiclides podalirius]